MHSDHHSEIVDTVGLQFYGIKTRQLQHWTGSVSVFFHPIHSKHTESLSHAMPVIDIAKIAMQKSMLSSYIIQPHRLTLGGIARRSPLGKVRSLLSSSTEFRFSTHSGSTSPSNIIHYKNTQHGIYFCFSSKLAYTILY